MGDQAAERLTRPARTAAGGGLPPEVEERLQTAGHAQLELWGERVLDASTLADVFGD